jgi:hypothetical protein
MVSAECQSESVSVRWAAGNGNYSCEEAGGKDFKVEFEGTCPYSSEGFSTEYGTQSGDSNCVGTSCTVKEFQASFDAMVTGGQSSYEGCSNFKVSSLDPFFMVSAECKSDGRIVSLEIDEKIAAGSASSSYSCEDVGGKVFKVEFEGTCVYSRVEGTWDYIKSFGDSNCVGMSCTVKMYQESYDALVTRGDSAYEGCSNFKVSSGAFSLLGTAGCVMAGLLLSTTAALFN